MNLISLFRSQELCQKLSVQSRFDMKNSREQNDFYQISKDIYRAILNR